MTPSVAHTPACNHRWEARLFRNCPLPFQKMMKPLIRVPTGILRGMISGHLLSVDFRNTE